MDVFIYLFGVLCHFQHCTGHITTGRYKGRGNQYIQFARVLYCKLPTNNKQLPAFPLEAMTGIEPRLQRWEARVLPLCHRGPCSKWVSPLLVSLLPFLIRPCFHLFESGLERDIERELHIYIGSLRITTWFHKFVSAVTL